MRDEFSGRFIFVDANCHMSREFIFTYGKILRDFAWTYFYIFTVARYVMLMSSMIMAGKKQIFAKLS